MIGLDGSPGQFKPAWPFADRADAILPIVTGYEITAGITDDRHSQLLNQLQNILSEPLFISSGMTGFIYAAINGPSQVLDE
ncbi:hypothetical protein D3C71_2053250 [compost metagenome]